MKRRRVLAFALACAGAWACAQRESTGGGAGPTSGSVNAAAEYHSRCAFCHGERGEGNQGPTAGYPNATLNDGVWAHGGSKAEIVKTITNGVPETPMPPFEGLLTPAEIDALAEYVRAMHR